MRQAQVNLSPGHAYKPSMEIIEYMKENAKNLSVVPEIVSLASSIYRDIQVAIVQEVQCTDGAGEGVA